MREFDRIPDYLVDGLFNSEESDEDSDRTAEQEVDGIWQRMTVGDLPVIVRSANRRDSSVRKTDS